MLHEIALRADRFLDAVRSRRADPPERITVEPYLAHGSHQRIIARGRVFRSAPILTAQRAEWLITRLGRSVRRFVTTELTGIELAARLGSSTEKGVTDDEGYYRIELRDPELPRDRLLHEMTLDVPGGGLAEVYVGPARAHVPTDGARRLIVSDIDDTVLSTGATRTVRMLVTTMTGSAWTRQSFPGTVELYAGLSRGAGDADNAFVYVSSSPWNLHGFLEAFLQRAGLPIGPLFLRDLGVDEHMFIHGTHEEHKRACIDELLALHDLPLLLVGDTGQHDPEIYRSVLEDHPDRIDAVLLRHLGDRDRAAEVQRLFSGVEVPMALASGSAGLARAAESAGLTPPGWSDRVAATRRTV